MANELLPIPFGVLGDFKETDLSSPPSRGLMEVTERIAAQKFQEIEAQDQRRIAETQDAEETQTVARILPFQINSESAVGNLIPSPEEVSLLDTMIADPHNPISQLYRDPKTGKLDILNLVFHQGLAGYTATSSFWLERQETLGPEESQLMLPGGQVEKEGNGDRLQTTAVRCLADEAHILGVTPQTLSPIGDRSYSIQSDRHRIRKHVHNLCTQVPPFLRVANLNPDYRALVIPLSPEQVKQLTTGGNVSLQGKQFPLLESLSSDWKRQSRAGVFLKDPELRQAKNIREGLQWQALAFEVQTRILIMDKLLELSPGERFTLQDEWTKFKQYALTDPSGNGLERMLDIINQFMVDYESDLVVQLNSREIKKLTAEYSHLRGYTDKNIVLARKIKERKQL